VTALRRACGAEKQRIEKRLKKMGCNIEQTAILTTRQRQAAVNLFRGIDFDGNLMLTQNVRTAACVSLQ